MTPRSATEPDADTYRARVEDDEWRRLRWIGTYLVGFVAAGIVLQVGSDIPPWAERAPIEYFTAGLLSMMSLTSVLIGHVSMRERLALVFWVGMSCGLVLMAIGELFGIMAVTAVDGSVTNTALRERLHLTINDDFVTLFMWFCTGAVFLLASRLEPFGVPARLACVFGLGLQGVHSVLEFGDGELFTMPVLTEAQLRWTEEVLELMILSAYFATFLMLFFSARARRPVGDVVAKS